MPAESITTQLYETYSKAYERKVHEAGTYRILLYVLSLGLSGFVILTLI
tara:strand:- start:664 stop:810 length:147 start_codon:yes stop_codon:yes gene_type:complete